MADGTIPKVKDFKEDFFKIFSLLKNGEKFAFSKYADGEYDMLRNERITNCDGWTFRPDQDMKYREELLYSFRFNQKGYYVGISCPCCVPAQHVAWMRQNVGVSPEYLTWANLFVNSNYELFKKHFIPEFSNHDIILVAVAKADVSKLPFEVEEHYGILKTAWRDNFWMIDVLCDLDVKDKLFLFCAGPLGNMLAARLWEKNKNNVYMDIGSTLNPWLVGNNRGYLRGRKTINKTCIW